VPRTFARQFPRAVAASLHVSDARVPARAGLQADTIRLRGAVQMRIYLTHCCAKKAPEFKGTSRTVLPDILYTATPTQRFMQRCVKIGKEWAIFSDRYGVWFPDVEHEWYEKDPNTVTEIEFASLRSNLETALARYAEIMFYHNPGRFHPLYGRLLAENSLAGRVKLISHLRDIQ